jgi:hypothetical protein
MAGTITIVDFILAFWDNNRNKNEGERRCRKN